VNQLLSNGLGRRFPLLWGLLTATYAAGVVYRALVTHIPPGLPSFAGISAVTAVWLDYLTFVRDRLLLRYGVLLSLLAALVLNTAIIARRILEAHTLSVGRMLATLLFLLLLADKARDIITQRGHR
jgi:hypothetical protein